MKESSFTVLSSLATVSQVKYLYMYICIHVHTLTKQGKKSNLSVWKMDIIKSTILNLAISLTRL